jgi:hypothetical protein
MKGILFFLVLSAFLVPSDTPADVMEVNKTVALDEVFALPYGQGVNVAEEGMNIYFTGVPENSRCPRDIACYCPGQVSVIIQVENDDTIESHVFTMIDDQRVTQNLGEYIVSLLSVRPYTEIHDPPVPEGYVVELIVDKKH